MISVTEKMQFPCCDADFGCVLHEFILAGRKATGSKFTKWLIKKTLL